MNIRIFIVALISSIFIFYSHSTYADSDSHLTHFVDINGHDTSDCLDNESPCRSIKYAIDQAVKASHVHISTGTYEVSAEDVVHFLGDKVPLMGGYTTADGYKVRSDADNPVTLVGIPFEFRDQLAAKGFKIIADTKAISESRENEIKTFTDIYQRVSQTQKTAITCVDGLAGDFPCSSIDLMSQFPLTSFSSSPSSASDVWGHVDLNDNSEYALIGLNNGTAIIDLSDPENPAEVGIISGRSSTWRDIKVYQFHNGTKHEAYAYVTTEASDGLQIIDLNDLPNNVSLINTVFSFQSAHNIYISNVDYSTNTSVDSLQSFIYIAGSDQNSGAFQIFDLVDPANPALVTTAPVGTGYVHDATTISITDARTDQCLAGHDPCELYIDFNESTVDIWDMTDKSNPYKISATSYPNNGYTHSGWYSKDKNYIFIQDELDERNQNINTTLRVMDIRNLAAPSMAGTFTGSTKAIDHNGFTLGDKYFMSNYRRGLTVLDVLDPASPLEIGYFDTFPAPADNSANFDGAWGTYPYLPSGNILVSDINNGLFVLKDNSILGEIVPAPVVSTPVSPAPPAANTSGGGSLSFPFLFVFLFHISLIRLRQR